MLRRRAIELVRQCTKKTVAVTESGCGVQPQRTELFGQLLGVLCGVGEELCTVGKTRDDEMRFGQESGTWVCFWEERWHKEGKRNKNSLDLYWTWSSGIVLHAQKKKVPMGMWFFHGM